MQSYFSNNCFCTKLLLLLGGVRVHVIDYWWVYQNQPLEIFMLWKRGIGVWGGVLGGFAGGVLCAHINK